MEKFVKRSWRVLFVLMSFIAVTACDDDDDIDTDLSEETFMQQAAGTDFFEIETGNMAMQNANMEEVRQFGEQLVEDHTMSSSDLAALAPQKNIILPTTMPEDKRTIRNQLANLEGEEFDREFINAQIQAHEEAITLYEEALESVTDADVRAFAQEYLPGLRMHLQRAQELQDMLD